MGGCVLGVGASLSCYFSFSNWGQMEDPRERSPWQCNAFVLGMVTSKLFAIPILIFVELILWTPLCKLSIHFECPMPKKQSMVLLHVTWPRSQRQSEIEGKSHTHKEPWKWHMDKAKCHQGKEKKRKGKYRKSQSRKTYSNLLGPWRGHYSKSPYKIVMPSMRT